MDGLARPIKAETGGVTITNNGSQTNYAYTTNSVVDTQYTPCACTPVGKTWKVSLPHAPGATTLYWTEYVYL